MRTLGLDGENPPALGLRFPICAVGLMPTS